MSRLYGSAPIEVAKVNVPITEMMYYQYLPIAFPNGIITIEDRLAVLDELIGLCAIDFESVYGSKVYLESYMYLTIKNVFVTPECNSNRSGWHCDGFMSDDVNYIWCDSVPTEYFTGSFDVVQDHKQSMKQFDDLSIYEDIKTVNTHTLYRLDETVIHRCSEKVDKPQMRCFIKVSFSKEKYNLIGNSHNYLLDYDWKMVSRDTERNHPSK